MAMAMGRDPISILLVGIEGGLQEELAQEEGFSVERAERLDGHPRPAGIDAVVLALGGGAPLESLGTLRAMVPSAAVVVVTDPQDAADGTVALHAGADDHVIRGSIPPGLLPRAIRYAVSVRRLRRELSTRDDETGLPNLLGFAPIAEHHLRMADRARTPVVFVFVRLDGLSEVAATSGADEVTALVRDAAAVVLEAVRDADVPARIGPDTFCVLLTGEARGAETLVLSRLVEAIAEHDARLDAPRPIALALGSALYDPEQPSTIAEILEMADRRLAVQGRSGTDRSEAP
jgi:diguanylate cyclase (GGDEF)-like protein